MVLAAKVRFRVATALLGPLGMFTFGPVPAYASTSAPTVTITGQLIQFADQTGPAVAAVRTADNQLVPVEAAAVRKLKPGAPLTLNVVVPAAVRSVAAANRTLTVRGPNGKSTSTPLDAQDLAAASDGTPEPATSDLGRATVASAVSTGQALAVSAVVSAADPVGSFTPAPRHLFVAIVTPKGWSTPNPISQAQIYTQVAGASTYWSTVSGGAVTLDVATITAPYSSAFSCADPTSMFNEAIAQTGFKGDANTSLVVELPPKIPGCSYGLGSFGANVNGWGMLYVSDKVFPVLAHELGHNMSLRHADTLDCPSASDSAFDGANWTGGCQETSYGDGDDVMAASRNDFAPFLSSPQSLRTGLIPAAAAKVISSDGTTDVVLNALGSRIGVRAAEIVDPSTGVSYYVEYRTALAPDTVSIDGDALGVRVLRFNPNPDIRVGGTTVLLDPTPTAAVPHDTDDTVRVGGTFTSYSGTVHVTTISSTSTTALVRITRGITAPPVTDPSPMAAVDSGTLSGGTYTVSGWAFDPDAPQQAMFVDVYDRRPDGSQVVVRWSTGVSRPDVAGAYPGTGQNAGFSGSLQLAGDGRHSVCVYSINIGPGANRLIRCLTVDMPSPKGSLDTAVPTAPGALRVSGWAVDPGAPTAVEDVHIYVTGPAGRTITLVRTGNARPDVVGAFPWSGPSSGFTGTVPTAGIGVNQVCAYAITVHPPGTNPLIGCKTVTVANAFGNLDVVRVAGSQILTSGWALNPNNRSGPVEIHVYDQGPLGTHAYSRTADQPRPDVGLAYDGYGPNHGFSATVPAAGAGVHSVCVYAITSGGGTGNPLVGCANVTVP